MPPLEEERLAAAQGTTLPARPAPPTPESESTGTGPRGQIVRKFDYTHLGDVGAQVVARWVAGALAATAPDLRSQLVR